MTFALANFCAWHGYVYHKEYFNQFLTRQHFYLAMAVIDTLKERTEALSERFFKKQVLPSGSLLHYLLPDRRDNDIINKLHKFRSSFIPYALNNFI